MSALGVLVRKELQATFTAPIAYAVAAVFLLVLGYGFSVTLLSARGGDLTAMFHQMYVLLVLLVPAVTMRAFAEERKSETLELLLTAPVSELAIVVAKFLAMLALVWSLLVLSVVYVVILALHGTPDWGPVYGGYVAVFLLACLLVAVGTLISSLTQHQAVAAAASLGVFLVLWLADSVPYPVPPPFDGFVAGLSLLGHFTSFVSGAVFLSDVGYYVTVSLLALFLTTRVLGDR
ncbi:MAG: ABC transporter permease [Candidatus Rokuibacteriota bacterium]